MSQLFKPIIKCQKSSQVTVLNRNVDGVPTDGELLKHSRWNDVFVNSVCSIIYQNPAQIAWVGNRPADGEVNDIEVGTLRQLRNKAWLCGDGIDIMRREVFLDGKYLVNHTKEIYFPCDDCKISSSDVPADDPDYDESTIIHPLPLLTAIGATDNDFNGVNKGDLGAWAYDRISVEDEPPDGYEHDESFYFYH